MWSLLLWLVKSVFRRILCPSEWWLCVTSWHDVSTTTVQLSARAGTWWRWHTHITDIHKIILTQTGLSMSHIIAAHSQLLSLHNVPYLKDPPPTLWPLSMGTATVIFTLPKAVWYNVKPDDVTNDKPQLIQVGFFIFHWMALMECIFSCVNMHSAWMSWV